VGTRRDDDSAERGLLCDILHLLYASGNQGVEPYKNL